MENSCTAILPTMHVIQSHSFSMHKYQHIFLTTSVRVCISTLEVQESKKPWGGVNCACGDRIKGVHESCITGHMTLTMHLQHSNKLKRGGDKGKLTQTSPTCMYPSRNHLNYVSTYTCNPVSDITTATHWSSTKPKIILYMSLVSLHRLLKEWQHEFSLVRYTLRP